MVGEFGNSSLENGIKDVAYSVADVVVELKAINQNLVNLTDTLNLWRLSTISQGESMIRAQRAKTLAEIYDAMYDED